MKRLIDFFTSNWGLKILALIFAIVVFYSMKEPSSKKEPSSMKETLSMKETSSKKEPSPKKEPLPMKETSPMKEDSSMKKNSHTNVQDNGRSAFNLKGPADGGK